MFGEHLLLRQMCLQQWRVKAGHVCSHLELGGAPVVWSSGGAEPQAPLSRADGWGERDETGWGMKPVGPVGKGHGLVCVGVCVRACECVCACVHERSKTPHPMQ